MRPELRRLEAVAFPAGPRVVRLRAGSGGRRRSVRAARASARNGSRRSPSRRSNPNFIPTKMSCGCTWRCSIPRATNWLWCGGGCCPRFPGPVDAVCIPKSTAHARPPHAEVRSDRAVSRRAGRVSHPRVCLVVPQRRALADAFQRPRAAVTGFFWAPVRSSCWACSFTCCCTTCTCSTWATARILWGR
jgi:hypothetical protein